MGHTANQKRKQPQPLNVEVGKREADAIFHRRDRAELLRQQTNEKSAGEPDEFGDWLADVLNETDERKGAKNAEKRKGEKHG